MNAIDHRAHRHAARGMGLRIEEYFRMTDVVTPGALQVSHRHIIKILLGQ